MKLTLSLIKADVGSIGGHTKPSERMMDAVRDEVRAAISGGLLIDGFVSHTGDDIAILMTHTNSFCEICSSVTRCPGLFSEERQ